MTENDNSPPWFKGICLKGKPAKHYEVECGSWRHSSQEVNKNSLLVLDRLAPITIFVGANNTGKSRLMRDLFFHKYYHQFKLATTNITDLNEVILSNAAYLTSTTKYSYTRDPWILNNDVYDLTVKLTELKNQKRIPDAQISWLGEGIRDTSNLRKLYIPMLRGMRPPGISRDVSQKADRATYDIYEDRTRKDYFSPDPSETQDVSRIDNENIRIFTGLGIYEDLRKRLLGRTQKIRDSVRDYEIYLSVNFFGSRPVTLVPVEEHGNDVVHIKIGESEEFPIHQLGDGMQSLIICTYPIITETEPGSLFFLEEPDLCMHPSMQRSFVKALIDCHHKKGHQFFMTTHSNHLLDLLEDNDMVSIFCFSEIESAGSSFPKFRIRQTMQDERRALVELGVRPSATYLANATMWVEGNSDASYLRAYMEAFVHYLETHGGDWGKKLAQRLSSYKEDRHYAFVEYNGANLTHFDFSSAPADKDGDIPASPAGSATNRPSRLCGRAIVIADGDIEEKHARQEKFSNDLREQFIKLPGKEIENLIPEQLMRNQITADRERNVRIEWPEPNEFDVFLKKIAYADYAHKKDSHGKHKGIGEYLESLFPPTREGQKTGFKGYKENSGTISSSHKKRWASEVSGIPVRIREAISGTEQQSKLHEYTELKNGQELADHEDTSKLPDHLTYDIIWLCIRLYAHAAKENHDTESYNALDNLRQFVLKHFSHQNQSSDTTQVSSDTQTPDKQSASWPIPCPDTSPVDPSSGDIVPEYRQCLLSLFLSDLENEPSNPSAVPSPEPSYS